MYLNQKIGEPIEEPLLPSEQIINIESEFDRGNEMLTITVEIGNGQQENIIIYENDTAERVAEEFCSRYENINAELKELFTNQIEENIREVKAEIEA